MRFLNFVRVAVLALSAGLAPALVAWSQADSVAAGNPQAASLDELRRIIQQQQQVIAAQQKRLDELEKKMDAVYPQQKIPAPARTTAPPKDVAKKDEAQKDGINLRVPGINMTLYGFLRGDLETDS